MINTHAITSASHAATLLAHPVRSRILALARQPISAADLARQLALPRQRVNYHVRQLAGNGFLENVSQQKKRNMLEQQYLASARFYVLDPVLLGDVAADPAAEADPASASHLVALCAATQSEVASVMESAERAGVRLRTLSVQADLRFQTAAERAEFMRALNETVRALVARHTKETGRAFRLIVGGYPVAGGTSGGTDL